MLVQAHKMVAVSIAGRKGSCLTVVADVRRTRQDLQMQDSKGEMGMMLLSLSKPS